MAHYKNDQLRITNDHVATYYFSFHFKLFYRVNGKSSGHLVLYMKNWLRNWRIKNDSKLLICKSTFNPSKCLHQFLKVLSENYKQAQNLQNN